MASQASPEPAPPAADPRPDPVDSDSDSDSDPATGSLFADPEGFYPPTPPPTTQTYTQPSTGRILTLRLVGHSPLEAHTLWNGARIAADHLDAHPELVRGRAVLELGAGAGLPSLVAGLLGAARVVVTDFPDPDLVANLHANVDACAAWFPGHHTEAHPVVVPAGFVWGADARPLLALLPPPAAGPPGFDVLVLADLLFRHAEHGKLVKTVRETLARRRGAVALVVFSSYRPWLRHKDLAFFDAARDAGLATEKLFDRIMPRPLFEHDPGDEEVRKTVSAWAVRWPAEACED